MIDLIERKPLYEQTAKLEAQALDYVGRLIERDGEEPSEEWRIWSAVLAERTAFKHDVFDAPSAEPEIICCEDCKYADGSKPIADGRYWCKLHSSFMYYCSDAEMKENG